MELLDKTYFNKRTKITASILGVLLGLAGILNHGIFEIFQGYIPTNGFILRLLVKNIDFGCMVQKGPLH